MKRSGQVQVVFIGDEWHITWVADASGNASSDPWETDTRIERLEHSVTLLSGASTHTVALRDALGVDVLGGVSAPDNATSTTTPTACIVSGPLTIEIVGAANDSGFIRVVTRRDGSWLEVAL